MVRIDSNGPDFSEEEDSQSNSHHSRKKKRKPVDDSEENPIDPFLDEAAEIADYLGEESEDEDENEEQASYVNIEELTPQEKEKIKFFRKYLDCQTKSFLELHQYTKLNLKQRKELFNLQNESVLISESVPFLFLNKDLSLKFSEKFKGDKVDDLVLESFNEFTKQWFCASSDLILDVLFENLLIKEESKYPEDRIIARPDNVLVASYGWVCNAEAITSGKILTGEYQSGFVFLAEYLSINRQNRLQLPGKRNLIFLPEEEKEFDIFYSRLEKFYDILNEQISKNRPDAVKHAISYLIQKNRPELFE